VDAWRIPEAYARQSSEMDMNRSTGSETQTFVIPLWPRLGYSSRAGSPVLSPALVEERREVFESVLNGLRTQPDNSDARAACQLLLRHLAATVPDR
jgi:hypothetical protein